MVNMKSICNTSKRKCLTAPPGGADSTEITPPGGADNTEIAPGDSILYLFAWPSFNPCTQDPTGFYILGPEFPGLRILNPRIEDPKS